MGNLIRIIVGLGGMVWAGWMAVRAIRARRAGEEASFVPPLAIMGGTAVILALTAFV